MGPDVRRALKISGMTGHPEVSKTGPARTEPTFSSVYLGTAGESASEMAPFKTTWGRAKSFWALLHKSAAAPHSQSIPICHLAAC